jgi:DNA-binding transcriptional MerR regulator
MAKTYDVPEQFEYEYKESYNRDWDTHKDYIKEFDAYEAMVVSQVFDSVSRKIDSSKISDGYATTLAKERADRVIAKLPEGVTESVGKADAGKAAFMDIIRQKWYYPNANAQHPFLEKLNMWQFYSSVYGYMPMFYDWNVAPTGYAGPDCWLWNPRNLVPQAGRISIEDMDYVTALTWVSKLQLENILDQAKENEDAGWDIEALEFLISIADQASTLDTAHDTEVARKRTSGSLRRGVCLATRYEAGFYDKEERPNQGRWCVFSPDHGCIKVRETPNPHKNGRIPFVIKYSQPLFDSFYGLGDFQRAKSLQFSRDALDNFYFSGIKMNLIPPLVANANGVIKHTLDYRPGGVILETLPNSVRRLETSNAGLSTYQAAKSTLTGSLLSQFGSQNAALPAADSLDPSQGRTPAAIDLYSDKEATRDGAELRHMEAALEQLVDGFNSLTLNIGTEDIPIQLFAEDINDIKDSGLEDVMELFITPDGTGTAGDLRINPEKLKGVEYRFNITAGSTTKMNKEKALAGIERLLGNIGKFQNLFKDDPRIDINFPRIMKVYEEMSDIKGASDFITIKPGPSPQEAQLQQQNQELQSELQQAQQQLQQLEQQMKMDQFTSEIQKRNDETTRAVTDIAKGAVSDMNKQPEAVASKSGLMFNDKDVASAADAIHNM